MTIKGGAGDSRPFDEAAIAGLWERALAARGVVGDATRSGLVAPPPAQHAVREANKDLANAFKANKVFFQKAFARAMRPAARRHAVDGWRVTGTGLLTRTAEGNWGHVVFSEAQLVRDQLAMRPNLGALSAYLMRVVNGLDPDRPPPVQFLGAHVQIRLVSEVWFGFDEVPPPPLASFETEFDYLFHAVLSPATSMEWIDQFFAVSVPAVSAIISDLAMRDCLVDRCRQGHGGSSALRYAALLTRHLGLDDQLPEILASAERATEEEHEYLRGIGMSPRYRDRSTRYPQDWSHRRFLRFLAETPR